MLPRLLGLLLLLSSLRSSVAQKSGTVYRQVPDTCAVTKPTNHPLVPPPPYRAPSPNSRVFLFGTDRFWTQLPTDGIWSQGEKTFWYRQEWGGYNGKGPQQWIPESDSAKLKVTARRLDGPALLPEVLKANSSRAGGALLIGGINFPIPGCWEVSGRYEGDELTFVVWVVKQPTSEP
jgi:hypothetical protein